MRFHQRQQADYRAIKDTPLQDTPASIASRERHQASSTLPLLADADCWNKMSMLNALPKMCTRQRRRRQALLPLQRRRGNAATGADPGSALGQGSLHLGGCHSQGATGVVNCYSHERHAAQVDKGIKRLWAQKGSEAEFLRKGQRAADQVADSATGSNNTDTHTKELSFQQNKVAARWVKLTQRTLCYQSKSMRKLLKQQLGARKRS